ncbi:MAG: hypothetical protein IJG84_22350, partial [Kiritimatiellae bacterium]|nr:hypothetical protein [Kiritimatiellia bacterium]
ASVSILLRPMFIAGLLVNVTRAVNSEPIILWYNCGAAGGWIDNDQITIETWDLVIIVIIFTSY